MKNRYNKLCIKILIIVSLYFIFRNEVEKASMIISIINLILVSK